MDYKEDKLDCLTCGACCSPYGRAYFVSVEEQDDPSLPRLKVPGDSRVFLPVVNDRCAYLVGEIGKQASCSIYSKRPFVCQSFMVGGKSCLLARELAGLT